MTVQFATLMSTLTVALVLALAPAAAAADEAGAPGVGLSRLMLDGLPVTLVYPSSAAAAPLQEGSFVLQVALDGPPAPGVFPLVLMSHGSGGNALADHALAATLARAGLVVAQPQHAGDSWRDSSRAGPEAWRSRPGEMLQALDALSSHPQWGPRLRVDRVGVHGMSAGGMTALALAGGQWRTLDMVRHCLAHGEQDSGFCYFGLPDEAARAQRRASYERARGVPELFLPRALKAVHGGRDGRDGREDPRPDARVGAVSVAVPVVAPFLSDSLARIGVPVGLVSAGRDTVLRPSFDAGRLLQHCRRCETLAELPTAGHFDLLAPWPADLAARMATVHAQATPSGPALDPAERQRAFDAIAAFHQLHLRP